MILDYTIHTVKDHLIQSTNHLAKGFNSSMMHCNHVMQHKLVDCRNHHLLHHKLAHQNMQTSIAISQHFQCHFINEKLGHANFKDYL